MNDPDFSRYPVHEETLLRWVRGWLKQQRFVFAGCEDEAAAKIVHLAKQTLGLTAARRDEELQRELSAKLRIEPLKAGHQTTASLPPRQRKRPRKALDLLAVPDDQPEADMRPFVATRPSEKAAPVQLAMF